MSSPPKNSTLEELSFSKRFLIQLIRIKELPYGFAIIVTLLGFITSSLWEDSVIVIKYENTTEIAAGDSLVKKVSSIMFARASSCALKQPEGNTDKKNLVSYHSSPPQKPLYLHEFTLTNKTINLKACDTFSITFGFFNPGSYQVSPVIARPQLGPGDQKPRAKQVKSAGEVPCKDDITFNIQNLYSGISIPIQILTTEKDLPFYTTDFKNSGFHLESESFFRNALFYLKTNSLIFIPLILFLLVFYFFTYAYVQVKYPPKKD